MSPDITKCGNKTSDEVVVMVVRRYLGTWRENKRQGSELREDPLQAEPTIYCKHLPSLSLPLAEHQGTTVSTSDHHAVTPHLDQL